MLLPCLYSIPMNNSNCTAKYVTVWLTRIDQNSLILHASMISDVWSEAHHQIDSSRITICRAQRIPWNVLVPMKRTIIWTHTVTPVPNPPTTDMFSPRNDARHISVTPDFTQRLYPVDGRFHTRSPLLKKKQRTCNVGAQDRFLLPCNSKNCWMYAAYIYIIYIIYSWA
jgi:hypothetical protein